MAARGTLNHLIKFFEPGRFHDKPEEGTKSEAPERTNLMPYISRHYMT